MICLDDDCSDIASECTENPPAAATADNLAYIVYTSGSAGYPKGVLIPHRALVNHTFAMAREFELSRTDRVLQFASISFDVFAEEIFPTWSCGAAVIMHQGPLALPVTEFLGLIERLGITVVNLPAPYWHEWASELERKPLPWPARLRLVVTGSQRVLPECAAAWQRRSRVPLINAYGVSEAAITALIYRLPAGPPPAIPPEVPIGRPISNLRAYVLDRHLSPVPVGAPGELFLGGDGLMRGYLGQPELTAEKLIRNPFSQDPLARLYRTGDRVRYQADGNIIFLGRTDQQLKLHGYRIEPAEIETVLARHALVREAVVTLREDGPSDRRLIAYIVPARPAFETDGKARDGKHETEQVRQWRALYDGLYDQGASAVDRRFNTFGWNSTATGEAIPEPEMREWLAHTVSRIRALEPARVLEIGCGLGLILFAIAPHTADYAATDFSPVAIDYLRKELKRSPLPQVRLYECAADELSFLPDETFDTIILNSVVQYFPSADYLIDVLRSALSRLTPGGTIFVGDVRNLPLLEAFDASLELQRAPAQLATPQLRKRVHKRAAEEQELVLDPRFFAALTRLLPIGQAEVSLKGGRALNELTQFRYDVVLRKAPENAVDEERAIWDWHDAKLTLSGLRHLLSEERAHAVQIRRVPNRRVSEEMALLRLLHAGDQAPPTVELLRKALRSVPQTGVDPAELWEMAEALSLEARISWSGDSGDGSFDVLFTPRRGGRFYGALSEGNHDTYGFANTPLLGAYTRRFVPELRRFAKRNLPDYMVPSVIVLLDAIPLLANGKLDGSALPAPDTARTEIAGVLLPPRNETEAVVAQIWAGLLGLERVGVNDNFFDLGGHSLLATQVMSRLRDRFQVELPLHWLFEGPTVAHLARAIEEEVQEEIEALSEEEAQELLGRADGAAV